MPYIRFEGRRVLQHACTGEQSVENPLFITRAHVYRSRADAETMHPRVSRSAKSRIPYSVLRTSRPGNARNALQKARTRARLAICAGKPPLFCRLVPRPTIAGGGRCFEPLPLCPSRSIVGIEERAETGPPPRRSPLAGRSKSINGIRGFRTGSPAALPETSCGLMHFANTFAKLTTCRKRYCVWLLASAYDAGSSMMHRGGSQGLTRSWAALNGALRVNALPDRVKRRRCSKGRRHSVTPLLTIFPRPDTLISPPENYWFIAQGSYIYGNSNL